EETLRLDADQAAAYQRTIRLLEQYRELRDTGTRGNRGEEKRSLPESWRTFESQLTERLRSTAEHLRKNPLHGGGRSDLPLTLE
ncbi:MAG: hypothetical protein Q4C47_09415, partial [Planctomycetia bacterium]|nr:hypothetical protein [Planctomycetia bacterium]